MDSGSNTARINAFKQSTIALMAICSAWLIFSTACATLPKSETITTIPRAEKSPTTNARFVPHASPQQPAVTSDRDLEAVGDNVARALVRLGERNHRAALEALDEARLIIRSRFTADIPMGNESDRLRPQLEEVAREITQARTQIERGNINRARQQLISINIQLDRVAR